MSDDKYNRIIRRFKAAFAVFLLLLAALFALDKTDEYKTHLGNVQKRSFSAANVIMLHTESILASADSVLLDLVDQISSDQGTSEITSQLLQRKLSYYSRNNHHFRDLVLLDSKGKIKAYAGQGTFGKTVDLSANDFFSKHLAHPADSSPWLSVTAKDTFTGDRQITLSRPVRSHAGRFDGVVTISIDIHQFIDLYDRINLGAGSRVLLVRNDGQLLLAAPFSDSVYEKDFRSSKLFREHLPYASQGTYRIAPGKALLGEPGTRIVSYMTIKGYPLVALANLELERELEEWLSGLLPHVVITGLLVLFSIVLSILFVRQLKKAAKDSRDLSHQQQELLLKAEMIDSVSDAILLLDENGALVQFSDALCRITGRSRQELDNRRIQDFMPEVNALLVEGRIQQVFREGEARYESYYLHSSGRRVPVEGRVRVVEINLKRYALSVLSDISGRRELESKLKAVASEWRDTFDAIEDAVWLLDMDRRIVRANRTNFGVFGPSPSELVGMSCCELTHKRFAPNQICPFELMLESRKRASILIHTSGRWFEISLDPVMSADGEIVNAVHIIKDITAMKLAELRERARSRILESIAGDESLSRLLDQIALAVEKECPEAICSIMVTDETGKRLLNGAAPSLPDYYNDAVNRTRIAEGSGTCGTAAFRRERFAVEDINTHPFWAGFAPARVAGLRGCWSEPIISSGGVLLGTIGVYYRTPALPSDEEILSVQQAAVLAGIAIQRERSEVARDLLQQQLNQSQKMEAIGHLAGGVAHDFNNLLTPIMIYSEMLRRMLPGEDKFQSKIDGIIKASSKARDLSAQLLSFGRKQPMQMKTVNLNQIIESFNSILKRTVRESVHIDLRLSSQHSNIMGDSPKIEQVLLNLAINAQDAIADTGRIVIETGQVMIDDEIANLYQGVKTGRYILLSFSDNGCGMSEETIKHIFEPFYTTKETGHGTGLGLANVFGIVSQHEGYIDVQSAVGKGTTFNIYLPICDGQPDDPAPVTQYQGSVHHAGEGVILLVEDNDMVREMAIRLLQEAGYRVFAEGHPEQALILAGQITDKIDLLLTDVIMPGMNGVQLYERLKIERPDIENVLYMSGYTDNVIVTNDIINEGTHLLHKPFTADSLLGSIAAAIGRPG